MAIFRGDFSYSWLSRGYLVANRGYFVAIMIKILAVAIFQRGYFHFSYELPIQRDMKIATKSVEHGSQNPRKTHMEIATGSCLLGGERPGAPGRALESSGELRRAPESSREHQS